MRDITERQKIQMLNLGLVSIVRGMGWSKEAALKMKKNADVESKEKCLQNVPFRAKKYLKESRG